MVNLVECLSFQVFPLLLFPMCIQLQDLEIRKFGNLLRMMIQGTMVWFEPTPEVSLSRHLLLHYINHKYCLTHFHF